MYAKPLGIQSRKHRQSGMTTVGMMIIGLFVGIIAFAGIRLTPVYLNYMKVVGVVDGIAVEFDGTGATRSMIRSSVSRRFDIESVGQITARDIKLRPKMVALKLLPLIRTKRRSLATFPLLSTSTSE